MKKVTLVEGIKSTNMKKNVCLIVVCLVIGSSFAQPSPSLPSIPTLTSVWGWNGPPMVVPDDVCSHFTRFKVPTWWYPNDPPTPPIVITVPQQKANEDVPRNLFFIHGLGGDATAWTKVSHACWDHTLNIPDFSARNCYMTTHCIEYDKTTKSHINNAASKVRGDMYWDAYFNSFLWGSVPEEGIIIAHSQGGVVSRALMHMEFVSHSPIYTNRPPNGQLSRGFGGLVTVASPLQGAMILNNRPRLIEMANDACNALIAGPGSSILANWLMKNAFGGISNVCNTVTGDILNLFVSKYYDGITASYTVGAADIDKFNTTADLSSEYHDMPKVAFYAVEPQENILWRTANWLVNNPNDVGNMAEAPDNMGYFEANDDWQFYNNTVYPAYLNYQEKVKEFEKKYDKCRDGFIASTIVGIFTGWVILGAGGITASVEMGEQYLERKNAYQKGVNWFDQANAAWQVVIGARRSVDDMWEVKENDGIVLKESAWNLPYATNEPIRLENSSHMQVRNNSEIKKHLNKLFNGDYGPFFETEKVE